MNKAEKLGTDCRAVACPKGGTGGLRLFCSGLRKSQFTTHNIRPCPVTLQAGGRELGARVPVLGAEGFQGTREKGKSRIKTLIVYSSVRHRENVSRGHCILSFQRPYGSHPTVSERRGERQTHSPQVTYRQVSDEVSP